jgi:hypothetical protein
VETHDPAQTRVAGSSLRRSALRGPQDLQEARLRDAVGRLQVLLLRDLVGQFEADERDLDLRSDHRGWIDEDALVSRALGVYGSQAAVLPTERALVLGVLEDLRRQSFADRLDFDGSRRAWRLRRQNEEIIDSATRFVDDHRWVPPTVDVSGVIQAVAALSERERPRELPERIRSDE